MKWISGCLEAHRAAKPCKNGRLMAFQAASSQGSLKTG